MLISGSTSSVSYELLHFDSLPSTNDYLKSPLPEEVDSSLPVFVLADQQTAGRGRLGRSWDSPKGGIYMSLLWPLPVTAEQAVSLPLLTALAVRLALQPYFKQAIVVKWPNDLLVQRGDEPQKLAGILVELAGEKLIIGVGVNVWNQADSGSSLLEELSRGLIHRMLEYLIRYFELGSTFAMFADEYRQHMARIGDYVELRNATGQLLAAGTLEGISDAGHVIIASETNRQAIPSGDVTFRAN